MRRKSPVTVQQWVDSLPGAEKSMGPMTPSAPMTPTTPFRMSTPSSVSPARHAIRGFFFRDVSIQSDDTSNCSSVESVLESRRPDPEAVLLGLGFGPPKSTGYLSRIPQRFLQPSRVNGIDVQKFLEDHSPMDQAINSYANCSQIHSLPVSPIHSCDSSKSTKKNSL